MWVVRAGEHLYVRSAYGYKNPWFQRDVRAGKGRMQAGGVERDVAFDIPAKDLAGAVSDAYRAKYGRYGGTVVGSGCPAWADWR